MLQEKPVRETLEKLAIEFQEAGTTKWNAVKIIKEFENAKLNDLLLREQAFEMLKKLDPQAAAVFESFQKMKVYNSNEQIKTFDRGNIIHSLLKETTLSRTMAEKIGAEVENKLKDLNLQHLNTSLIREMVAVKLLEYGQENAHEEYTRIGMPVFEVQKHKLNKEFLSGQLLAEYNWLKEIPKKIRELHFNSAIHVTAVHDFCTKNFTTAFYFEPKEPTAEKQIIELGTKILEQKQLCTKGLCIESVNNSFAGTIEKFSQKKIRQTAGLLLAQLNASFRPDKNRDNTVTLELFDSGKSKQTQLQKEKALELAKQIIREYHSFDKTGFSLAVKIDSKYRLKLIEKNDLQGLFYLNCSENDISLSPLLAPAEPLKGISTLAGINLPKIAISSTDQEEFMEKLAGISGELSTLFMAKQQKNQVEQNPGRPKPGFVPSTGLFGIETSAHLLGAEKNIARFLDKLTATVKKHCGENTLITELSEKKAVQRFELANRDETAPIQLQPDALHEVFLEKKFDRVFFAQTQMELEHLISKNAKAVFLQKQA